MTTMTTTQLLITVGIMVLDTALTRFLPFLCFPDAKKTPAAVRYLGRTLPYAAMGMLVIYCLKDVGGTARPAGGVGAAFDFAAAPLAAQYPPQHIGRHGGVYAAGAARFLKGEAGSPPFSGYWRLEVLFPLYKKFTFAVWTGLAGAAIMYKSSVLWGGSCRLSTLKYIPMERERNRLAKK